MSLAYYKKYPRDFMEGTITLTFEEKGAYAILLDLIYMRSGRLEDDARWIAGHLGCSVRLWNKVRLSLISKGKISCENGIISNFRADLETESSRSFQEKQRENRTISKENKEIQKPNDNQKSTNQNQNQNIAKAIAWPERSEILKELSAECGEGIEDPNTSASMMMSIGSVLAWQAAGYDWRMVKSVVAEKTKHPKAKKISSWSWFQKAMSEAHETWIPPADPKEVDDETRRKLVEHKIKTGNWLSTWGSPPTIEEERKVRELISKSKEG